MFKVSENNINSAYLFSANNDANYLSIHMLGEYIDKIETSLNNNTWMDLQLAITDRKVMPHLVALANKRNPALNLVYIDSPYDLPAHLMSLSPNDYHPNKYIICTGDDKMHTGMLDARFIDNKLSMILFEPTSLNFTAPALLALRINSALEQDMPGVKKPFALQVDIQRSDYECGIFSLALAKKTHKNDECVLKLHHEIAAKKFEKVTLAECKSITDKFLPVICYKHTQGLKRLSEYLEAKPESIHHQISGKHKQIMNHIKASYTHIDGKLISKSIHLKRLTEYKALRDDFFNDHSDLIK
ncbi:YopJ family acetyltransferase [Symbiopectobacterium purcellii]|uniref:Ubiquitin-like protease family profile domain-containing protein n=1 Tax=Symbiopectobacterium purcellii TaxID=2871826 RepID=A0ABX9AR04_9ENTR|nr:YopJ family acetyltransferase [Symbiopectobacterium purcellii]QZN97630.1 hypothetical protein K6K13_10090 [Symbiopectobacterium purcellii]